LRQARKPTCGRWQCAARNFTHPRVGGRQLSILNLALRRNAFLTTVNKCDGMVAVLEQLDRESDLNVATARPFILHLPQRLQGVDEARAKYRTSFENYADAFAEFDLRRDEPSASRAAENQSLQAADELIKAFLECHRQFPALPPLERTLHTQRSMPALQISPNSTAHAIHPAGQLELARSGALFAPLAAAPAGRNKEDRTELPQERLNGSHAPQRNLASAVLEQSLLSPGIGAGELDRSWGVDRSRSLRTHVAVARPAPVLANRRPSCRSAPIVHRRAYRRPRV
jgi:hypothetical protein